MCFFRAVPTVPFVPHGTMGQKRVFASLRRVPENTYMYLPISRNEYFCINFDAIAMKKISDQEFADFLTNKPLYYKITAVEGLTRYHSEAFIDHLGFKDKPFKFLCPNENEIQTFRTDYGEKGSYQSIVSTLRHDEETQPYTFDDTTHKLDFKFHIHGICQSCKASIDFLIRTISDKEWDRRNEGLTIYLQKVGQYPAYDISLNNNLKKYLSEEDQIIYKKALTCLSISYGIGSYAYFRRIIENEIKKIIKDISELEFDGVQNVRDAFFDYQKDFQMSKLIDVINKHLPLSLKELGDNPIRLLYEQLSGGIHGFTDEECVKKSVSIDILINYVVKKINEEKYQLNDVKSAMLNLRK